MIARFLGICLIAVVASGQSSWGQVGAVRHVHDPTIIQCDDYFYLFGTGKGIPVRRSVDLVHWEMAGRVFDSDAPEWALKEIPRADNTWAPDISYHDGLYYLYYAVSTFGKQRSCIGLAVNETLDASSRKYRWVDRGKIIESIPGECDFNAIDASVVADEMGQRWLAFGSFWSGIKLVAVDGSGGIPSGDKPRILSIARRPRRVSIEAADIIRRNGYYYLFVSFDQCCKGVDSTYRTMVGRSERVTGPYVDYTGKPMMEGGGSLMLQSHDDCRGPGHNDVIRAYGRDWLCHHMYDAQANGAPTLQIRPLLWGRDGWPVAGEPIGDSMPSQTVVSADGLRGQWMHSVDYRVPNPLMFLANGKVNDEEGEITWDFGRDLLTLRWPRAGAPGGAWVDQCVMGPTGDYYVGRNQGGNVIRGLRVKQDIPKAAGSGEARDASRLDSMVGVGIQLENTPSGPSIVRVLPDSPAFYAGVEAGEIITAVNGVKTAGIPVKDIVAMIVGPEGSRVELALHKEERGERTVTVFRGRFAVTCFESRMVDGGIGIVDIDAFNSHTLDLLRKAITEFANKKAKGLVIDLRGNKGGKYQVIVDCAALFLVKWRTLWLTKDSNGKVGAVRSKNPQVTDLPLVVVIDGNTGGGELFAAAMKRNNRGKIVGQQSSGLAAIKSKVEKADGSYEVKVMAEVLMRRRQPVTGVGVKPDVVLGDDVTPDVVLEKAIELLR